MLEQHPSDKETLNGLTQEFLVFAEVERGFSKETIIKYRDCLRQVQKVLGDFAVADFSRQHLLTLKAALMNRNLGVNRQVGILLALKSFFRYLKEERQLGVFDPDNIKPPRRPRKEVPYLKAEEVVRFVHAIKISSREGTTYVAGLRFRTLVETLLGSAMRISEVLSLDRGQIDFDTAEAKIIGKGRKERTVFFTERALYWIKRYLETRADECPALFVCQGGETRLKRPDIWRPFAKYRKLAGLEKRVTAHLLRHTAATQLLFNGCPVGHIKEILGHERLETTCRYYLGLDHRAAKAAHRKYLTYSSEAA